MKTAASSALGLLCALWVNAAAPAKPLNVLFIAVDDMRCELGCFGAKHVLTPNLDRLAGEGMIFTDAHSGSSVCTPTRYGLLTGRYAWRTRLQRGVLGEDHSAVIQRLAERAATAVERMGERGVAPPAPPQRAPGQVSRTIVAPALDSAVDWLPGLRDEHVDASDTLPASSGEAGAGAPQPPRRNTWDPSVTPNVIKRRGERPKRRG